MDDCITFELDNKEIGNRIRTLREERNLSQAKFAENAGISNEKAISKLEKGVQTLSVAQLAGIAKFCGVTMEWIVDGKKSDSALETKEIISKLKEIENLISSL